MITQDELRTSIHRYIVENFLFGTEEVSDDASLMDEGILDSTGVLEMVLFVEEELGVAIGDDEVLPENFDTINSLTGFVAARMGIPSAVAPEIDARAVGL